MLYYLLHVLRLLITVAVVSFSIDAVSAGEIPDALTKKLAEFKGAERGQTIPVESEPLNREFREYSFHVLRFRQYPVALAPPEPLKANNLFIVKPDGSVELVADTEKLKNFFRVALAPVKTEAGARDTAAAWLHLAQELYQDGFFRFSLPEDSIQVATLKDGGLEISGKSVVNPQGGNSGEINVALTFDPAGALTKVSESIQLRRGVRPKCQATKLLDPDPIVRGMAEQAILVMGSAAREYLEEQRAKAGPELGRAIDEIWRRIVVEGW